MISASLSWCWIGVSAFLFGYAFLYFLNKFSGYKRREFDVTVALGICALTVYAQAFSLFCKVGLAATVVLLIVDAAVFIRFYKDIIIDLKFLISIKNVKYVIVLAFVAGLAVVMTSQPIAHYDTFLYHAQSIRWIEEYGVVKGLGNLHNRLAYNSSIFSLEALFSLKFLLGRSLHTINGFVVTCFLGYALCALKVFKQKRIFASDFLRIAMIFFIGYSDNLNVISSSGSDLLALGLVIYILIKWVSYIEEGEQNIAPYAYMCILGVYAFTVKLSAAMIVLLVIMPAMLLISSKRWKDICGYIVIGLVVALPFFIRNVLISGYLIYPYPELDLFHVDWKMPVYTLLFDRNEIKTWGWGINDVFLFDTAVSEWIPVWYEGLSTAMKGLFISNVVLGVLSICFAIYRIYKSRNLKYPVIIITIIACFAMWFAGSPLMRYGSAYLVILPAYFCGDLLAGLKWNKRFAKSIMSVLVLINILPIISEVGRSDLSNELQCPDYYWEAEAQAVSLGNEIIYVPTSGDQLSYYVFPSTPYEARLNLIELRGETIAHGFRMKEQYSDANVSTYGQVYEENIFKQKK